MQCAWAYCNLRGLRQAKRQQEYGDEAKQANNAVWAGLRTLEGANQLQSLPQEVFYSLIIAPTHDYAKRWLAGRCTTSLLDLREVFADAAWASVRLR